MLKQACPEDSEPLLKQVQYKVQNDTFRVQHDVSYGFQLFTSSPKVFFEINSYTVKEKICQTIYGFF